MTTEQIPVDSEITITLIKRNRDGVPVEKTVVYPDGREETEALWQL